MSSNATAGDESRVNIFTTGYQGDQIVTALADGGWLVTWDSPGQDGDDYGIYQQRYDADGTRVGAETLVNTHTTGNQLRPSVTLLASGGWLVTWVSDGQDGSGYGIYQQRYGADGTSAGAETLVNTHTTGSQRDQSVAGLFDGGWVVTWRDDSDGLVRQRYDAHGAKDGIETQVEPKTSEDSVVAGLADGGWIATWRADDGDGWGVYQQRYDAEGVLSGSETRVNTYTTNTQDEPSVAVLADGGWVVTWESSGQDGDFRGIYLQRYDGDGAPVGAETQVNTYTSYEQVGASVAGLADGGWVVVWESLGGQDGDSGGVYQQRYNAHGQAAGTETLVNSYTTGEQGLPSVAALDDGSWVVSWSSPQDGDGVGVYQRHYAPDRTGTAGGETVVGTNWSETIAGRGGADTLRGFGGRDIIEGGTGLDRMSGGKGQDMFVFEAGDTKATIAKADVILDMNGKAGDEIDLHLIDARETQGGNQAFKFIGTSQFTGHEGQLRYETTNSNTYIYGDTDGDKKADFAIHLDDAMTLKDDYFVL